jgi:multicomponent Na+:H+ antiporter subunit B
MAELIDVLLFAFLLATAVYVLLSRDLLAVVMVAGIYSLLSAGMFLVMDAADVAFTEAAVGAGLSTLLLLIALTATGRWEKRTQHRVVPLLVVLATGATLVYGTLDLPPIGKPDNPPQVHVAPHYLERSGEEIGIPNVVTSVLASYRGFDTLGEVVVVFTAGLGVYLLIAGPRRRRGGEQ